MQRKILCEKSAVFKLEALTWIAAVLWCILKVQICAQQWLHGLIGEDKKLLNNGIISFLFS